MPSRSFDGIRSVRTRTVPAYAPASPATAATPVAPAKRRTTYRAPYRAILLYSVIGSYLYLLAAPILPRFTLADIRHTQGPLAVPTANPVTTLASVPAASPAPLIPGPNTLTLASAGVDGQIYEGPTEATLSKGIWHVPGTSSPDKGGNTVLAAHRFMFLSGGNTFYNLDKVKEGDTFSVVWSGVRYTYQVYDIEVVTSRTVQIEDNTAEPIVTLFTCTPLWTSKDRLVVRGKLLS